MTSGPYGSSSNIKSSSRKRFSDSEDSSDRDEIEVRDKRATTGGGGNLTPNPSRSRVLQEQRQTSVKKGPVRSITISESSSNDSDGRDTRPLSRIESDSDDDNDDDKMLKIRTTISNRRLQQSFSDLNEDDDNGDFTPLTNKSQKDNHDAKITSPTIEEFSDDLEGIEELEAIDKADRVPSVNGKEEDLKWGTKREKKGRGEDRDRDSERYRDRDRDRDRDYDRERERRYQRSESRRSESPEEREQRKRRERRERERRERNRERDTSWEKGERSPAERSPWRESERRDRHDRYDREDSVERRERRERRERYEREERRRRRRKEEEYRRRREERDRQKSDEDDEEYEQRRRRQRQRDKERERERRERRREREESRDRERDRDRDRDRESKQDRTKSKSRQEPISDISDEDGLNPSHTQRSSNKSPPQDLEKDKDSKDKDNLSTASDALKPLPLSHIDLTDKTIFLLSPIPKSPPGYGMLECNIQRHHNGTGNVMPIYTLTLKENNAFLMCSQKCSRNKTSNYHISKADNDLSKYSPNYLGKLRGNFLNSEYQLFDNGRRPDDLKSVSDVRKELCAMIFTPSLVGSIGPRKIQVCIPLIEESEVSVIWKQQKGSDGAMMEALRTNNLRNLSYFINKSPRWSPEVNAYVLSFGGRVSMTSVKNFQLVSPNDQDNVILQVLISIFTL